MKANRFHSIAYNIPYSTTPFVGRKENIGTVQNLLEESRLVTLTGPGGVGKTRLAQEVAQSVISDFDDGIKFVPLATVFHADHLIASIAQSLKLSKKSEKPHINQLIHHLRNKDFLLVLDNFEQLLSATSVLDSLLKSCARLKLLVTSRFTLNIYGEFVHTVPPLRLPKKTSLEEAKNSEAIVLFTQRARAIKSHFILNDKNWKDVVNICTRLDGLPLAIELAAARLRILSPKELFKRLEHQLDFLEGNVQYGKEPRQTLRQTISWSYKLLNDLEKSFFIKLSAFQGGFDLKSLQVVINQKEKREFNPLNTLEGLVEKSLVYQKEELEGGIRFYLLEAIRSFAWEHLASSSELYQVKRAHALYFVELAEQHEVGIKGNKQLQWLDQLQIEWDNIQAAMEWILAEKEAELGMRLGGTLWRFWFIRLFRVEGMEWLTQIVNLPEARTETFSRAKALEGLGLLHSQLSHPEEGMDYINEAIAIWKKLDNYLQVGTLFNHMSWLSFRYSSYENAIRYAMEAKRIHLQIHNKRGIALALGNLGWVSMLKGEFSNARKFIEKGKSLHFETKDWRNYHYATIKNAWIELISGNLLLSEKMLLESIAYLEKLKEGQLIAFGKHVLGKLRFAQMNYVQAYQLMEESEALFQKTEDSVFQALIFCSKSKVSLQLGEISETEQLLDKALEIFNQKGQNLNRISESYTAKGEIEWAKGNIEDSLSWYQKAAQHNYHKQEVPFLIENLEGICKHLLIQNNEVDALRLMSFCDSLRTKLKMPLLPYLQEDYERNITILKAHFNFAQYEKNWKAGKQLSKNQAINIALRISHTSSINGENIFHQIQGIIENRMGDEHFNTDVLCQVMGMSRTHLHRTIKSLTHQSTASYIRSIRLQKAKSLVETTDLSIGEIGICVGFKDLSHFSRSFLHAFGIRPSKLRSGPLEK